MRPYSGLHVNPGYTFRFDTTDTTDTTDAPTVRPYSGLHVSSLYVRCVRPRSRLLNCMSCRSTTDALPLDTPVRPYTGLLVKYVKDYSIVVLTGTDALRLDTPVRSYTGLLVKCIGCVQSLCRGKNGFSTWIF